MTVLFLLQTGIYLLLKIFQKKKFSFVLNSKRIRLPENASPFLPFSLLTTIELLKWPSTLIDREKSAKNFNPLK